MQPEHDYHDLWWNVASFTLAFIIVVGGSVLAVLSVN